MPEVLLRPNLRAIYAGMVLPAGTALGGLALIFVAQPVWLKVVGWVLVATNGMLVGILAWQSRQPRVGYRPYELLFYLRLGAPIRVPLEIVECCFLGSGPLKLTDTSESGMRTANLVFRLADKATEWAKLPIKPALGRWTDGYITIHGAWCERLTLQIVQQINVKLHEAQRAREAAEADARATTSGEAVS